MFLLLLQLAPRLNTCLRLLVRNVLNNCRDISYNQLSGVLPTPIMNSQIYYMYLCLHDYILTLQGFILQHFRRNNDKQRCDSGQLADDSDVKNLLKFGFLTFGRDFSGNTFHCELPPFLRLTALSFKVNVNGSKFFCPVTSAASAVIGEDCGGFNFLSVCVCLCCCFISFSETKRRHCDDQICDTKQLRDFEWSSRHCIHDIDRNWNALLFRNSSFCDWSWLHHSHFHQRDSFESENSLS